MTHNSNHTPGPWKVSGRFIAPAASDCDRDNIASYFIHNYHPEGISAAIREADANARLIAAAPRLLEERDALAAALREIAETPCDHGPGFCPRERSRAALARLDGGAR